MRLSSAVCGSLLLLVPLGLAAQEFPVNTSKVGLQVCPAVVANPEGGYLVLFGSITSGLPGGRPGVLAQRFGLSGERIGAEFALNTEDPSCLAAVPSGPGRLLVAWGIRGEIIGRQTVYARHFDYQGNALSPRFQAGEGTAYAAPAAACDADGRCWVAWITQGVDSVRARRFSVTGQPLGDEIRLDAPSPPGSRERWDLELSADPQGGFVASWWSGNTETGPPEEPTPPPNGQVRLQRVSATGELLGEIGLGTEPATFAYSDGAVCHPAGGGFFAAVSRVRIDLAGPDAILLRRFDASGSPVGLERFVAEAAQPRPSLENLHLVCGPDGMLLLWTEYKASGRILFGRFFNLSGDPSGAPFLISESGGRASATLLGSGHFLAAWEEYQLDADGYDIVGRVYRAAANPLSLHGGRFKVEATFREPHTGALGQAEPRPLTDDTGT
ncbi:MAG: hypothetical protein ACJ75H_14015, partial [Thermoanaerobaculia bacterium]